jgi:HD-GYP domain-containing protein (c-di-GMP phosphodiesterase class II)
METPRIVLSGNGPSFQGLAWESNDVLRIGRQDSMDIVLQDLSVAKLQAEVRATGHGWIVRDLAQSERTPTYHNGAPLRGTEARLSLHDILQFGRIRLKVDVLEFNQPSLPSLTEDVTILPDGFRPSDIKTSRGFIRVEAVAHRSWDEALQTVVADPVQHQQQSQHLLTLLRAGHHLGHISSLDELLHSILEDALRALNAQRGAIVLADARGHLHLRAMLAPKLPDHLAGLGYSRTLAQRCYSQAESLLCQDVKAEAALMSAASVRRGSMTSIICAVLRSPRRRLGVVHLDRGPFQDQFTTNDFYLADAIAASVAVGIESAQLVEQQREEFIQAVTSLARTVEMRDQYTGDHTRRVTDYSLLLANQLRLSPQEIYQLQIGTPLHDIGKIGVDDAVLRKPGRLTPDEFEQMKTHTVKGATILQSMASLDPMIPIVRHHHERWDGRGYPDGLASDDIPQIARVVAVADAFDAMTSNRPYRKALPAQVAFAELHKNAGTHFDPLCVQAFLSLQPQIESLMSEEERPPIIVRVGEK